MSRATEIQALIEAEAGAAPFLVYAAPDGSQAIHVLDHAEVVTIGRSPHCSIPLPGDGRISRVHAQLEPVADGWVLADDGLSRNGTFVNTERVPGRRRLSDGDRIRLGDSTLQFRDSGPGTVLTATLPGVALRSALTMTPAQRRVLVALARPSRGRGAIVAATNKEIADELVVSIDTVKTHLKALFERFEVDALPNNQKRARLVELALELGFVGDGDFQ